MLLGYSLTSNVVVILGLVVFLAGFWISGL